MEWKEYEYYVVEKLKRNDIGESVEILIFILSSFTQH